MPLSKTKDRKVKTIFEQKWKASKFRVKKPIFRLLVGHLNDAIFGYFDMRFLVILIFQLLLFWHSKFCYFFSLSLCLFNLHYNHIHMVCVKWYHKIQIRFCVCIVWFSVFHISYLIFFWCKKRMKKGNLFYSDLYLISHSSYQYRCLNI